MIKSPCVQTCPDRRVGCRSECPAFEEYEAAKLVEYNARQEMARMKCASPAFIQAVRAKQRNRKRGRKV